MGNQFDLNVRPHGELLDSHTGATLGHEASISVFRSTILEQMDDGRGSERLLLTGFGSSKKVS